MWIFSCPASYLRSIHRLTGKLFHPIHRQCWRKRKARTMKASWARLRLYTPVSFSHKWHQIKSYDWYSGGLDTVIALFIRALFWAYRFCLDDVYDDDYLHDDCERSYNSSPYSSRNGHWNREEPSSNFRGSRETAVLTLCHNRSYPVRNPSR